MSSTNPYPTGAGRPPNVCGKCGAQWWTTHTCPMMTSVVPLTNTVQVPSLFLACSIDPDHGIAMSSIGGELVCAACLAEFKQWRDEKRATA